MADTLRFEKMHGLGNDYIYINLDKYPIRDLPAFARKYSDRRFGIGGDGVVTYSREGGSDYRMRIFNIDGSEGLMCGNAIRCVAKLLYEEGLDRHNPMRIDTASGVKILELTTDESDRVQQVRVDMGRPELLDRELEVSVEGAAYTGMQVSMGNPHFVTVIDSDPMSHPLEKYGPLVEQHPYFPDRVNFEIVQVTDRGHLVMRVYERGSGLTLACGTGACATAVAAIEQGLVDSPVEIRMPGGTLTIEWSGDYGEPVFMTGPATRVYKGEMEGDFF